MSYLKYVILLYGIIFMPLNISLAQIQLGGLADFEIRKGGSESSMYVNQTPNGKWAVYTPAVRLFFNSNISDNWYILSTLQADHYNGVELSEPFFSVININWVPLSNSDLTVSAGRFVIPYGAYSNKFLSSDNSFVHLPLSHASGLPVSKTRGILYEDVEYAPDETGMNMVYQRMYTQGIKVQNNLGENNFFSYNLALTLASASSFFEYGKHNKPAITGRLSLHPAIWMDMGLSFSYGAFMKRDSVNNIISDKNLSKFDQTLIGGDLKLTYLYYTLYAEYNWSQWNAPYINGNSISGNSYISQFANASHFSMELIVDFYFLPGAYSGLRYENLWSGDLKDEGNYSYNNYGKWTYNRDRIEIVFGYKLERDLIMKVSYLTSGDNGPGLDDNVFTVQLSVGF